jgi:hypothetical protein
MDQAWVVPEKTAVECCFRAYGNPLPPSISDASLGIQISGPKWLILAKTLASMSAKFHLKLSPKTLNVRF